MSSVTIDQIGLKSHQRYAQDQAMADPAFMQDSHLVAPLSEINGTSMIYASQWETLFNLNIRNLPWANFLTPPKYRSHGKRFFSHRILPTIYSELPKDEDQEREDDQESEGKKNYMAMIDEVLCKVKDRGSSSESCLKESVTLVNLLESIASLNEMLDHIQSRRLQYQKG
jgi:hypothetical protein